MSFQTTIPAAPSVRCRSSEIWHVIKLDGRLSLFRRDIELKNGEAGKPLERLSHIFGIYDLSFSRIFLLDKSPSLASSIIFADIAALTDALSYLLRFRRGISCSRRRAYRHYPFLWILDASVN